MFILYIMQTVLVFFVISLLVSDVIKYKKYLKVVQLEKIGCKTTEKGRAKEELHEMKCGHL